MNKIYEAPELEIVQVKVENGFSYSLGYTDEFADEYFGID